MEEVNFNSNEMCLYLLKAVVKLQAENTALREFFLANVKHSSPGANTDTLRKGMVDGSILLVPQVLKSSPVTNDALAGQIQDELRALYGLGE